MKKTLPILLILLLLAACGGSEGADSPELATATFIEALQSGDPEDVYEAVVRSEAENFRKMDERLKFNRWDYSDIDEFEVKGSELDGNRARVTVLLTREIDDQKVQSEELVVCIQEKKLWKVSMSASSKVFIPSGQVPE